MKNILIKNDSEEDEGRIEKKILKKSRNCRKGYPKRG